MAESTVEVIKEAESAAFNLDHVALTVAAKIEHWADFFLPPGKQRMREESENREGTVEFKKALKELVVKVEIIRAAYKRVEEVDILDEK